MPLCYVQENIILLLILDYVKGIELSLSGTFS